MTRITYRDQAAPVVAQVIRQVGLADRKQLRLALFQAYPFPHRAYRPYRVWLNEIKRQAGGLYFRRKDPCQRDIFDDTI